MKHFFLASLLAVIVIVSNTSAVFALNLGDGLAKRAAVRSGFDANTDATTFSETLGTVVRAALSFLGVIFLMLMVYAGFLWMTARGDEPKVDKAQTIIRAAIIGMILTVGAYSITNYVIPLIVERSTGAEQSNT